MTLDQFIEHLGRTSPEYFPDGWRTIHGIRGRLPIMEPGGSRPPCCPITAVCHKITGLAYEPGDYGIAAELIELDDYVVYSIVRAADTTYYNAHAAAQATKALRARMLQAINDRREQQ